VQKLHKAKNFVTFFMYSLDFATAKARTLRDALTFATAKSHPKPKNPPKFSSRFFQPLPTHLPARVKANSHY